MNAKAQNEQLIEAIPEPQAVRERLAQTLRDTKILRHLLKVSERVAKDKAQRRGVTQC